MLFPPYILIIFHVSTSNNTILCKLYFQQNAYAFTFQQFIIVEGEPNNATIPRICVYVRNRKKFNDESELLVSTGIVTPDLLQYI